MSYFSSRLQIAARVPESQMETAKRSRRDLPLLTHGTKMRFEISDIFIWNEAKCKFHFKMRMLNMSKRDHVKKLQMSS